MEYSGKINDIPSIYKDSFLIAFEDWLSETLEEYQDQVEEDMESKIMRMNVRELQQYLKNFGKRGVSSKSKRELQRMLLSEYGY